MLLRKSSLQDNVDFNGMISFFPGSHTEWPVPWKCLCATAKVPSVCAKTSDTHMYILLTEGK